VYIHGLTLFRQTIVNNCNETIYPAYFGAVNELDEPNFNFPNPSGGFETPSQSSSQLIFTEAWAGIICELALIYLELVAEFPVFFAGARQGCDFSYPGGTCLVGSCTSSKFDFNIRSLESDKPLKVPEDWSAPAPAQGVILVYTLPLGLLRTIRTLSTCEFITQTP
jgi:hypothetical protein